MTLPSLALLEALRAQNLAYYSKVAELRSILANWLEYIPNTFPHYTRHGVSHSDEIISELSQLLFRDGDISAPAVRLSSMEIYILCACAYLHDCGMVVPETEKQQILTADAWKDWTAEGAGGAKRWREILELRNQASVKGSPEAHFIVDMQTRLLIAEYVRRVHHVRARTVLADHHQEFANIGLGDAALLRTIADICEAHGLTSSDLEDPDRYPDRRTIKGEQVNVRFLALLLRLGDLLDMSSARACPLLMSAASPLPTESLGHWSQYQRIVHRVTAPDRIELTAECETQDEHRLLQDWCTWLVDEAKSAQVMMARCNRHRDWLAPEAEIDGPGATIRIRPSPAATYTPSNWTFELDVAVVFERLIKDVYQFPLSFVRELLQNALDASRTQMYADLRDAAEALPKTPTTAPERWRQQYPVEIEVSEQAIVNGLSGETESHQVLSVRDSGIGMDADTIRRFLLQVGRSFYASKEFLDHFPFVPTSRFGVGFLSVFGASDHVTIETRKAGPRGSTRPIRLTLTGPRAYLLTERGLRERCGTEVHVRMKERVDTDRLLRLLRHWCKRVELPVVLKAPGMEHRLEPEHPTLHHFSSADGEGTDVVVRTLAYPIESDVIEGTVYIVGALRHGCESWGSRYEVETMAKAQPSIAGGILPANWIALHGINLASPRNSDPDYDEVRRRSNSISAQVDIRGRESLISLARVANGFDWHSSGELAIALEPTYAKLLDEHIGVSPYAAPPQGWEYLHRLAREFPLPSYWRKAPGLIRAVRNDEIVYLSIEEARSTNKLGVVVGASSISESAASQRAELEQALATRDCDTVIAGGDLTNLPSELSSELLDIKRISDIQLAAGAYPLVIFATEPVRMPIGQIGRWSQTPVYEVPFPNANLLVISLRRSYQYAGPLVLNALHPYTPWIKELIEAQSPGKAVGNDKIRRFLNLLSEAPEAYDVDPQSIAAYLAAWRSDGDFAPASTPPHGAFDHRWIGQRLRRFPRN